MKIVIQIRAEKSLKTEEERFLVEIKESDKLEEWRRRAETGLRNMLRDELDHPDMLEVSISVTEEGAEDDAKQHADP